jgi:hypothetical protein
VDASLGWTTCLRTSASSRRFSSHELPSMTSGTPCCAKRLSKTDSGARTSTTPSGPDGSKASGELLAEDYTNPSDKGNAKITEVLVELGYQPLI